MGQEVLERKRAGRLAGEVLEEHAGGEALVELVRPVHDPGSAAVSVERKGAVRSLTSVQVKQLELVGRRHPGVELLLVDEDAVRAFRFRLHGVFPPGALDLPERLGGEVPHEHLVRRIAERVLEGAEGGLDLIGGVLARRLRAVADEVGRVREDEAAAVDRCAHSTSHTVFGSTSASSIASARSTIRRRSSSSRPNGCVIAGPRTIRFAPIIVATVGKDVT